MFDIIKRLHDNVYMSCQSHTSDELQSSHLRIDVVPAVFQHCSLFGYFISPKVQRLDSRFVL